MWRKETLPPPLLCPPPRASLRFLLVRLNLLSMLLSSFLVN